MRWFLGGRYSLYFRFYFIAGSQVYFHDESSPFHFTIWRKIHLKLPKRTNSSSDISFRKRHHPRLHGNHTTIKKNINFTSIYCSTLMIHHSLSFTTAKVHDIYSHIGCNRHNYERIIRVSIMKRCLRSDTTFAKIAFRCDQDWSHKPSSFISFCFHLKLEEPS